MTRNFDDEFLNDFLDGHLSGKDLARAERLMLEDANFREQVDSWRAISRQCQTMPKCSLPAGFADLIVSRAFVSPPLTDAPVSQGSTGPSATSKGMNSPGKNMIRLSPLLYAGTLAASLLLGIFFFAWNRIPDRRLTLQDNPMEQGEIVNGKRRPIPFQTAESTPEDGFSTDNKENALQADTQANIRNNNPESLAIRTEKESTKDEPSSAAPMASRPKRTDEPNGVTGRYLQSDNEQKSPQIAPGGMARSSEDGRGAALPKSAISPVETEDAEPPSLPLEIFDSKKIASQYSEVWIVEVVGEDGLEFGVADRFSKTDEAPKIATGRIFGETKALALDLNQQNLFDVSGSPEELARLKGSLAEAFPKAKLESFANRLGLPEPNRPNAEGRKREEDSAVEDLDKSKGGRPIDNLLHVEFLGYQSLNQSLLEQFEPSTSNKPLKPEQQEIIQLKNQFGGTGLDAGDSGGGRSLPGDIAGREANADKEKVDSPHKVQGENQRRILLIIKPRS
jgi:hypothetical protein